MILLVVLQFWGKPKNSCLYHRTLFLMIWVRIISHFSCRKTVELVQRAEHAGVAWITVHGRTTPQRMEPANMEAIKLVGSTI